ncbi:MAG: hypothetical protein JOZ24_01100, partial [Candidatus Eremiobacteraeota bacterium]|nr:hypothetical protein [Candidatus Eremiobacteraeota bacterium]
MRRRPLVPLALATLLLGAAPSGPAAAFLDAWAKISSYTCDIKAHLVKAGDVQDRTYHYAFLKPHYAKIDITGGPGRGGGAVWTGGDTVSGHQGGILSGIHLRVSIHDGRAVDLRNHTMDGASFEAMADAIRGAPSISQGEETFNGTAYDTVTMPYSDEFGATKRTVYLSRSTHLPARRVTYEGDQVVETEDFTQLNTAANL